jgi:hypothetical protein
MTAELLRHLAQLHDEAAQFTTNPVWARSDAHARPHRPTMNLTVPGASARSARGAESLSE